MHATFLWSTVILCGLGALFSCSNFALPSWLNASSSSTYSFGSTIPVVSSHESRFGLLQMCTYTVIKLKIQDKETEKEFSNCFNYYSSSTISAPCQDAEKEKRCVNGKMELSIASLCSKDKIASLSRLGGSTKHDSFLQSTCGHLGKASISIGILQLVCAVLSMFCIVFANIRNFERRCSPCTQRNCLYLGCFLSFGAGLFCVILDCLWIVQSKNLRNSNKTTLYGVCFNFNVICAVLLFMGSYSSYQIAAANLKEQEREAAIPFEKYQQKTPNLSICKTMYTCSV